MTDISELVKGMRARFERDVRPHLGNLQNPSDCLMAHAGIQDILMILEPRKLDLTLQIHSGLNYFISLQLLERQLRTGASDSRALNEYDAYSRQTDLPL